MEEPPDSVVFNGVRYTRQPLSDNPWRRHYYLSSHGWRYLHRDVWEHANGRSVPEGHHVHHVDHDPFNNDPSNLRAVTPAEHAAEHAGDHTETRRAWAEQIRPLTKQWHASEEGLAWHAEHGRKTWEGRPLRDAVCEECGETFQTRRTYEARRCSRICIERANRADRRYEVRVPCPVCGQEFWQNKYRPKPETCSRMCGAEMRRRRSTSVAEMRIAG